MSRNSVVAPADRIRNSIAPATQRQHEILLNDCIGSLSQQCYTGKPIASLRQVKQPSTLRNAKSDHLMSHCFRGLRVKQASCLLVCREPSPAREFRHAYLDGVTIQRFLTTGCVDRLVITRGNRCRKTACHCHLCQ